MGIPAAPAAPPDPALAREAFIAAAQEFLAELQEWVRVVNPRQAGRRTLGGFAGGHDALIAAALRREALAWKERTGEAAPAVALAALGGYGRRALCLHSDIDLMVLVPAAEAESGRETVEAFVRPLIHLLTDCRLKLGSSVRTVADCVERVGVDLDSTTSMLEARRIAGDRALYERFERELAAAVARERAWLLRGVREEWRLRHEKFGSTVYLLEPSVKEGEGGLRDWHSVEWIMLALEGRVDPRALRDLAGLEGGAARDYRRAIEYIQRVRNELHLAAGNRQDRLVFAWQGRVAERLGYAGDGLHSAQELFMADYYRHARLVAGLSARAMRALEARTAGADGAAARLAARKRIEAGIYLEEETLTLEAEGAARLAAEPGRIMALLEKAAQRGWTLAEAALDELGRIARTLEPERFAREPGTRKRFRGILGAEGRPDRVLAQMHECGLLERVVPEFERLRHMVRLDHYHHYTVDEHTLKALEMSRRLRSGEGRGALARAAGQIERWDLLNLALLLHDVGKGYGRGHALRGGQIAQQVGDRLDLAPAETELVRFLVLSHLKLSHAAQRRDLSDPSVARQLATEIGSLERLRLLYVHTACDLMAVSPEMWNDWKDQLLAECYGRTAEVLGEPQEAATRPRPNRPLVRQRVLEALEEMRRQEGEPVEPAGTLAGAVDDFLGHTTDRYMQAVEPAAIARHFVLRRRLTSEDHVAWHLTADGGRGLSELSVCAADVPGLFHYLCGALAAKGINIWSARIFSTTRGEALNLFQVTDTENRPLPAGFRLERVRKDLAQVIRGERTIEELIERHKVRPRRHAAAPRPTPTRVIFDNEGSRTTTIIEIRSADRLGLLYLVTGALLRCRLDVQRAIITTEAYGVVDVFYVTDLEFNKIHDAGRQKEIEGAILEALAAPEII